MSRRLIQEAAEAYANVSRAELANLLMFVASCLDVDVDRVASLLEDEVRGIAWDDGGEWFVDAPSIADDEDDTRGMRMGSL